MNTSLAVGLLEVRTAYELMLRLAVLALIGFVVWVMNR